MKESYAYPEYLSEILPYSLTEVAYYRSNRNLFESRGDAGALCYDISNFPVFSMESIHNFYSDFIADPYHKFPKNQNVFIKRAFETGGNMFKMIWDRDDYSRMNDSLREIRQKYYGIGPNDRFCSFYTALYRANKIVDVDTTQLIDNGNGMIFNVFHLNHNKLNMVCQEMHDYDPKWLRLQPSIALLLAEFIRTNNVRLPKNLRYIEFQGEMVDESVRKGIEDVFGVTTAYTYTTNTVGIAAIECPCRRMHVVLDNVIIEVLKEGVPVLGEEGGVCVTGLRNHAMPIIRYLTGEKGVLVHDECACGNKAPSIKITEGDAFPMIQLKDGSQLSAYSLRGAIEFANEFMANAIKSMKIVQKGTDTFEAHIELKPAYTGWKKAVVEAFQSNIREDSLKQAKWDVVFCR